MDFFDLVDWNYGPAGTRWAALFYGLAGAIQPFVQPGFTDFPTARMQ